MQFRLVVRILSSIGISLLLLWILFSMVQDRPAHLIAQDMKNIAGSLPVWVLPVYMVCALSQAWFRALRYRLLLQAGMGEAESIPISPLFFLTLSRNMFVDMLPSRLGEASYLILLKRVLGTRLAHGLSSLSVSFAFDLAALTALVFVMGGAGVFIGQPSKSLLGLMLFFAGIVCIGLVLLFFGFGWALGKLQPLLLRLQDYRIIQSTQQLFEDTWNSILHIRNKGVLYKTFALSLAVRFFKYAGLFFLLNTILATAFPAIASPRIDDLIVSLVAGEAAASMPIPAFMGFGSYELGATWMLKSAGYSLADTTVAVFLLHLLSQIMDYSMGFCGTLYCIFTRKAES